METPVHRGSCLCGAVRFTVRGALPPPNACHCTQCRKHSGHFLVSTDIARSALTVEGMESVTWHYSSGKVRRGFCRVCGSSLFWDPVQQHWTAIAMGAFDKPTHARLSHHIYVADKGDYYELNDGLPQNTQ